MYESRLVRPALTYRIDIHLVSAWARNCSMNKDWVEMIHLQKPWVVQ